MRHRAGAYPRGTDWSFLTTVEHQWATHLTGARKRGDDPFAPGHHDVAPVVGHCGFALRESGGHQVGDPTSRAEACNRVVP